MLHNVGCLGPNARGHANRLVVLIVVQPVAHCRDGLRRRRCALGCGGILTTTAVTFTTARCARRCDHFAAESLSVVQREQRANKIARGLHGLART